MKTSQTRSPIPKKCQALPPTLPDDLSLAALRPPASFLSRAWQWIRSGQFANPAARRLRVAETVSLGDKRFVAVVQVDGRHFLVAGGPANVVLLAQLDDKQPFEEVLKKTMTAPPKQPVKSRKPVKGATRPAVLKVARPLGKQPESTAGRAAEHYA